MNRGHQFQIGFHLPSLFFKENRQDPPIPQPIPTDTQFVSVWSPVRPSPVWNWTSLIDQDQLWWKRVTTIPSCWTSPCSTTTVPTPAAPPAPVPDMHWQQHHFIAPAPEEETPLPAAWPEAPPKAAAATTATTTAATTTATRATPATTATTETAATTASQQPTADSQQPTSTAALERTRGKSSPAPFGCGVVLVVLVVIWLYSHLPWPSKPLKFVGFATKTEVRPAKPGFAVKTRVFLKTRVFTPYPFPCTNWNLRGFPDYTWFPCHETEIRNPLGLKL